MLKCNIRWIVYSPIKRRRALSRNISSFRGILPQRLATSPSRISSWPTANSCVAVAVWAVPCLQFSWRVWRTELELNGWCQDFRTASSANFVPPFTVRSEQPSFVFHNKIVFVKELENITYDFDVSIIQHCSYFKTLVYLCIGRLCTCWQINKFSVLCCKSRESRTLQNGLVF